METNNFRARELRPKCPPFTATTAEVTDVRLVPLVLVLAVATLASGAVSAGYLVWIRLVGLDPTLALRAAELPGWVAGTFAVLAGLGLGTALALLPSVRAGLAAVLLLASATFAGLLLFELHAARSGYVEVWHGR